MTKKVKKEVKIILFDNLSNSQAMGNLVLVKSGYARNYIIPKKKGRLADLSDIDNILIKKYKMELLEKLQVENKKILESSEPYLIEKKIGENKKIFGKITMKQLKQVLTEKSNVNLDNAIIEIQEIKTLGNFPIIIHLNSNIKAFVNIDVISQ
jgi:large subunit ribosomal protein L9